MFVYGTLRAGGSNHHLMRTANLVMKNVCLSGYIMYDFGPYPFVTPCKDESRFIVGEIYEIPSNLLAVLDALEGIEEGLYERIFEPRIGAWLYISGRNAPRNLPEIASGDWFKRHS